jgi:hypothetical protein
VCVGGFVGCAPALLVLRALDPTWMSWKAAVVSAALFGWLFLNGAAYFQTASPDAETLALPIEGFPAGSFTLAFGWLVGLVYFAPLAAFYALAQWLRRDPHGRRSVRSSTLRAVSGSARGPTDAS